MSCSHSHRRAVGLGLALLGTLAGPAAADVLFVDDDAALGGDGQSWSSAFAHLQDAIEAANLDLAVDQIVIAGGVYRPDTSDADPFGTGDRTMRFTPTRGITLLGGFAGQGASDPNARDLEATPTILDADLDGDDDPADPTTRADNAVALLETFLDADESLVLDGLEFQNVQSGFFGGVGFGAVGVFGGDVLVIGCRFRDNRALATSSVDVALGGGIRAEGATMEIVDSSFTGNVAALGGAIYSRNGPSLVVRGTTIRRNVALSSGGAIRQIFGGDLTILDCVVEDNAAEAGGALAVRDVAGDVLMQGVRLVGNRAEGGAAAGIFSMPFGASSQSFLMIGCLVEANESDIAVGGLGILLAPQQSAIIRDSVFRANRTSAVGGALGITNGVVEIVNCVFVGNRATLASALRFPDDGEVINCTFADNSDKAIVVGGARIRNSIIWACGPTPLVTEGGGPACQSCVDIDYSLVEGGWSGTGIVDADPLFVQMGTGNVRLTEGSPALDAGLAEFLPAGVTLDLDGEARIQGAAIDLGAYEGIDPAAPPASSYPDIDAGEAVVGGLDSPEFDPVNGASFLFINESDVADAELLVGQLEAADFPSAAGGTPVGIARAVSTEIPDGELRLMLLLPFDAADVVAAGGAGADPLRMNLARRDEATNAWALAASANTVPTAVPGIETALADRTVQVGEPMVEFSSDFGRWGVWWDPSEQRGVAWATTDRSGDYALVLNDCPADAAQPPNGVVDLVDLLDVLGSFGRGAGPWDVDGDGSVAVGDFTEILAAWGICP